MKIDLSGKEIKIRGKEIIIQECKFLGWRIKELKVAAENLSNRVKFIIEAIQDHLEEFKL